MQTPEPTLAAWIDEINQQLATEFELSSPNQCFLVFENGRHVGIDWSSDSESYTLYSPVGVLSSHGDLGRLFAALELNLYQRETAGGVVGLDAASGTLVYSFTSSVQHSRPEVLSHQLEHFAQYADQLQSRLDAAPTDSEDEKSLAALAESLGMLSKAEGQEDEDVALDDQSTSDFRNSLRV